MSGFTYKSYNFIDKDPMIDIIRTIVFESKLSIPRIAEESGVSHHTILKWLYGETKRPTAAAMNAVLRVLGYKLDVVHIGQLSIVKATPFTSSKVIKFPMKSLTQKKVAR